jgi:hypothetical protein
MGNRVDQGRSADDMDTDGDVVEVQFDEPVAVYQGRCNAFTDIKEANFFGAGEWIVSGSDGGNVFVWHKVCAHDRPVMTW